MRTRENQARPEASLRLQEPSRPNLLADLVRLQSFYARVEAALAHTTPPDDYAGIWVDYGNGVEADPYSWLRVLVAEALADCRP